MSLSAQARRHDYFDGCIDNAKTTETYPSEAVTSDFDRVRRVRLDAALEGRDDRETDRVPCIEEAHVYQTARAVRAAYTQTQEGHQGEVNIGEGIYGRLSARNREDELLG